MKVIIADNNSVNLTAAKKTVTGEVEIFELDVSKVEDYEKLKEKIDSEFSGMFFAF